MANEEKKLKYKTQEDAEKAHAELETKLGAQSTELGTLRKQAEHMGQLQQKNAALETWASQVKPVLDYVNKNRDAFIRYEQSNGQPAPTPGHQAPTTPGETDASILTANERQAIATEATQNATKAMNEWAMGTLVPHLEKWTNGRLNEVAQQGQQANDSFQRTLYAGLENALPKEQLDRMRQLHTETLRYADPSQIKPMEMANERIELLAKVESLEGRITEQDKTREDGEKQRATIEGMSGLGSMAFEPSENGDGPISDSDQLKAIERLVIEEHGAEALQSLY